MTITLRRASALAAASDVVVVVEACKTRSILLFAFDAAYTVGVFTDAEVETKPPRVITILPRRVDPDARRRMR